MESIRRERARSLKLVQAIFAVLALISLVSALAVSIRGIEFGLPETSTYTIALAFLVVGAIDTILLFAWEHISERIES